jgi:hypothetical protein
MALALSNSALLIFNNEIAMSKVYRRFDTDIQDLNEVQ